MFCHLDGTFDSGRLAFIALAAFFVSDSGAGGVRRASRFRGKLRDVSLHFACLDEAAAAVLDELQAASSNFGIEFGDAETQVF
jgi:hypothetical protein